MLVSTFTRWHTEQNPYIFAWFCGPIFSAEAVVRVNLHLIEQCLFVSARLYQAVDKKTKENKNNIYNSVSTLNGHWSQIAWY